MKFSLKQIFWVVTIFALLSAVGSVAVKNYRQHRMECEQTRLEQTQFRILSIELLRNSSFRRSSRNVAFGERFRAYCDHLRKTLGDADHPVYRMTLKLWYEQEDTIGRVPREWKRENQDKIDMMEQ